MSPTVGGIDINGRWARAVLHVDMDAFYVGVELLDAPELRGQPVVVGGSGRRGVVAAASYEARSFGVRSAMPSVQARRLCPHAVFLPGRHERYSAVSAQIMAIFRRLTPLVEPLSLDEAFLDVTGVQRLAQRGAVELATEVRRDVTREVGLSCSVGVAPTKFLAKLASEAAKPSPSPSGPRPGLGVKVVEPGRELEFLHPLPLRALWGVGPATLKRLQSLGIATVGELAAVPEQAVLRAVGNAVGRHLWALACGHDDRTVEPNQSVKSIGHEETFAFDLIDPDVVDRELLRLSDAVADRLRVQELTGRTMTLKVRDSTFHTVTRSVTDRSGGVFDSGAALLRSARGLFASVGMGTGVRLLGISVSGLRPRGDRQLSLDDLFERSRVETIVSARPQLPPPRPDARHDAEQTIHAIRDRFGAASIGPATLVSTSEGGYLDVLRPNMRPWGPDRVPPGKDSGESAENGEQLPLPRGHTH